jgi:hypothetical protein
MQSQGHRDPKEDGPSMAEHAQSIIIRNGRDPASSTTFDFESHVNPMASTVHLNRSSDADASFIVLLFAIHVMAHAPR